MWVAASLFWDSSSAEKIEAERGLRFNSNVAIVINKAYFEQEILCYAVLVYDTHDILFCIIMRSFCINIGISSLRFCNRNCLKGFCRFLQKPPIFCKDTVILTHFWYDVTCFAKTQHNAYEKDYLDYT